MMTLMTSTTDIVMGLKDMVTILADIKWTTEEVARINY